MEAIHAIDSSRRFEFFETACKIFAVPMEMRRVWSRIQFFLMAQSDVDLLAV